MTQEHPITPPPELVEQWECEYHHMIWGPDLLMFISEKAACWGADQQLELDAKWPDHNALNEAHLKIAPMGDALKEAMRPKPPSLKEQALEVVTGLEKRWDLQCDLTLLRRALEALDD
jgi:hypothetical protein